MAWERQLFSLSPSCVQGCVEFVEITSPASAFWNILPVGRWRDAKNDNVSRLWSGPLSLHSKFFWQLITVIKMKRHYCCYYPLLRLKLVCTSLFLSLSLFSYTHKRMLTHLTMCICIHTYTHPTTMLAAVSIFLFFVLFSFFSLDVENSIHSHNHVIHFNGKSGGNIHP